MLRILCKFISFNLYNLVRVEEFEGPGLGDVAQRNLARKV